MKLLFNMIILCCVLFGIGWFVSFQYDPYRVCRNHPTNPELYLCEPFGFEMQKGTRLERPANDRFPWEKKGDVIIGTSDPDKRRHSRISKAEILEEWECRSDFRNLSQSQIDQINIDEYCIYRGPSLRRPHNKVLTPENLPENSVEEM